MTISEQNIIKRWDIMASKDLGINRNVEARGFSKLFNEIFENDRTQVSAYNLKYILPIVRGFAYNNEGNFERCSVVECLDLCHINLNKESAEELDWYLMNQLGWYDRYKYAMAI